MMEIKYKQLSAFWAHSYPLIALFATVSALMAVWRPPGHSMPSWLLGILVMMRSYGCLALALTTRRPPGRIGRKGPDTIDAARESAIFRHHKPSVCAFSLAVNCGCCVDTLLWSWARSLEVVIW